MNGARLGSKCFDSPSKTHQAVDPPPDQGKAVPPQDWTLMPRCSRYHALSFVASRALKKIPPMPATRFMPRTLAERRKAATPFSAAGATTGPLFHLVPSPASAYHPPP